jgi:hypothetical protein
VNGRLPETFSTDFGTRELSLGIANLKPNRAEVSSELPFELPDNFRIPPNLRPP